MRNPPEPRDHPEGHRAYEMSPGQLEWLAKARRAHAMGGRANYEAAQKQAKDFQQAAEKAAADEAKKAEKEAAERRAAEEAAAAFEAERRRRAARANWHGTSGYEHYPFGREYTYPSDDEGYHNNQYPSHPVLKADRGRHYVHHPSARTYYRGCKPLSRGPRAATTFTYVIDDEYTEIRQYQYSHGRTDIEHCFSW